MEDNCASCKHFYQDHFCSYIADWCEIHGCIDCNPDSFLKTLIGSCPDWNKDIIKENKKIEKELNPFIDF